MPSPARGLVFWWFKEQARGVGRRTARSIFVWRAFRRPRDARPRHPRARPEDPEARTPRPSFRPARAAILHRTCRSSALPPLRTERPKPCCTGARAVVPGGRRWSGSPSAGSRNPPAGAASSSAFNDASRERPSAKRIRALYCIYSYHVKRCLPEEATRERPRRLTLHRAFVRESRGDPAPATVEPHARDRAAAERLWAPSEELAGVTFRL
jgi:hypothetical protein